jgi:hypothetical protein
MRVRITPMTAVLVTLLAVVVVLVVLVVVELRRAAPAMVEATAVEMSRPAILVFLTTTCTTCGGVWKMLGDNGRELPSDMELVVVTKGPEAEDRRRVRRLAPRGLRVLMSTETWERYCVRAAPHAVAVDRNGAAVAAAPVSTWSDVVATGSGARVS